MNSQERTQKEMQTTSILFTRFFSFSEFYFLGEFYYGYDDDNNINNLI